MRLISDLGFSRIPVALSEENPIIIGILLVKSLISVELSEQTIAELFFKDKIQLKVPIFLAKDSRLPKVGRVFKQGYSHMAVVCYSEESLKVIQTFCEKLHRQMKCCTQETNFTKEDLAGIADVQIIGVLTYEDVIERTLRVNINDEKDRAHAIQAVWMRSAEKSKITSIQVTAEEIMPHLPPSNFETIRRKSFGSDGEMSSPLLTDGVFASRLRDRYVSQEEKDRKNPPERQFTGYIDCQVLAARKGDTVEK